MREVRKSVGRRRQASRQLGSHRKLTSNDDRAEGACEDADCGYSKSEEGRREDKAAERVSMTPPGVGLHEEANRDDTECSEDCDEGLGG